MGMNKREFLNSPKAIECFVSHSGFRLPTNKTKAPAWLDIGDTLSINTNNKDGLIDSVIIERLEDRDLEPLVFGFTEDSKCEIKDVSDHILFLSKSGLYDPENPEITYKLEVLIQSRCGHNPNSSKQKVTFFFYQEYDGTTCIHRGGNTTDDDGGGWTK
ncbi:hypothetical protein [Sessilibacter corallicola]|uniref:Uncharacterized protein n=1 Tax=Sessilibacter corallicola TaxID=2904075 RepID=A0ABQ0AEA0_9GAMM